MSTWKRGKPANISICRSRVFVLSISLHQKGFVVDVVVVLL